MLATALCTGGCSAETEPNAAASSDAITGSILDAKLEKLKAAYVAADADDFRPIVGLFTDAEFSAQHRGGASARDVHWYSWVVEGRVYVTVDYRCVTAESADTVVIVFQVFDRGAELIVDASVPVAFSRVEEGQGTISTRPLLFFSPATADRPAMWSSSRGDLPASLPAPVGVQP